MAASLVPEGNTPTNRLEFYPPIAQITYVNYHASQLTHTTRCLLSVRTVITGREPTQLRKQPRTKTRRMRSRVVLIKFAAGLTSHTFPLFLRHVPSGDTRILQLHCLEWQMCYLVFIVCFIMPWSWSNRSLEGPQGVCR